jgi:hypothetical protein
MVLNHSVIAGLEVNVWIFFFQQGISRLHSTPQMDHAVTAVKETSASSIEQVYDMSAIILAHRCDFLCVCACVRVRASIYTRIFIPSPKHYSKSVT